MIDLWCVCVGDKYSENYVLNLHWMVKKNLNIPFRFNCITDIDSIDDLHGITCKEEIICHRPIINKGWWTKIDLLNKPGPAIYFDLDVVIVDDITNLAKRASSTYFSMPRNWARSGHGGFQSSFSGWSSYRKELYEQFNPIHIGNSGGSETCPHYGHYQQENVSHWGDQEWLTHNFSDKITAVPDGEVVSYKYHCQNGLPVGAKVVCFHGYPKYTEVKHDWIDRALA